MKDISTTWSISTFNIFLDHVNPDMASELMYDKEYLSELLEEIRSIEKDLDIRFSDGDPKVGFGELEAHSIAIEDFKKWITNL